MINIYYIAFYQFAIVAEFFNLLISILLMNFINNFFINEPKK